MISIPVVGYFLMIFLIRKVDLKTPSASLAKLLWLILP